jgi:hypothetical protein
MGKRKTTEQFVAEARAIHGDKYNYDKVKYVNTHTKVCVICPTHGEFQTIPCDHLHNHGCPHCAREQQKNLVYGVGINDLLYTRGTPSYQAWTSMLERCYDSKYQAKKTTYVGCSVCDDWLIFSNFKQWFDSTENGYKDGYQLDKDIIVKGNKVYSPSTCCIVPPAINALLTNRKRHRGNFYIGVRKTSNERFVARACGGKRHIGVYDTSQEAFYAYKNFKERYIKSVAEKYFQEGKITKRVYDALMKYEVDITD